MTNTIKSPTSKGTANVRPTVAPSTLPGLLPIPLIDDITAYPTRASAKPDGKNNITPRILVINEQRGISVASMEA